MNWYLPVLKRTRGAAENALQVFSEEKGGKNKEKREERREEEKKVTNIQ